MHLELPSDYTLCYLLTAMIGTSEVCRNLNRSQLQHLSHSSSSNTRKTIMSKKNKDFIYQFKIYTVIKAATS